MDIDSKLTQKDFIINIQKMGELESRMSELSLKEHKHCIVNTNTIYLDSDGKMLNKLEIRADHDTSWAFNNL